MSNSSTNFLYIYISILVPLPTKYFTSSTAVKEIPDLACFWKTGKLSYTPEQSGTKIVSFLLQKCVCVFFKLLIKALQRLAFEVVSPFHLFSFWYSLCLQLKFRTLKMLLFSAKFSWCSIKVHLDYQSFVFILQLSIPERTLVRLELTSLCLVLSS